MLTSTFTFNKALVLSMLVSILMVIIMNFFYCDYIILAFLANVNFSDDVTICIIIGDFSFSLNIGLGLRLGHETFDGLVVPFINDCCFINTFYVVCSFLFFNHGTFNLLCNIALFALSSFVVLIFNIFNVFCSLPLNV